MDIDLIDDETIEISHGDMTNFYHICGGFLFGYPVYCPDCEGTEGNGCGKWFVIGKIRGEGDDAEDTD